MISSEKYRTRKEYKIIEQISDSELQENIKIDERDYEMEEDKMCRVIVFIDAENVSVKDFEGIYRKKIKKFLKNHGLSMNESEFRAYAVEGAPTSKTWQSDGVNLIMIPGNPSKDKADNQILKELKDQAGKGNVCLLLTHDKGLQKNVKKYLDGVYVFDEYEERE